MADLFFVKLMADAAGMVAGAVVSIATDALGGQDIKSRITGFRKTAASHIRQGLDLGRPPSPATNHDLRRALCLAYTRAARPWVRAVAALPPHEFSEDQRKEKDAFLARVRGYLGAAERAAYDRTTSFEGWTGEGLMTALLDAVPESTLEGEGGAAVIRSLTEAFRAWIADKEGQGLPEAAQHQLFETSGADGVVLFGQSVLQAFIEILKSGDYIEATRAFEQRVAAGLRDGVRAIAAEVEALGGDIARLGPALSRVETLIDQSALSLARVETKTDRIEALTRSIEARLALKGRLALSRKPVGEGGYTPFVEMTFSQRRTAFVGREGELHALRAFLAGEAPFSWWQIAGEGGQGKSRLALHLIDDVAAGWDAGFLPAGDLRTFDWSREAFPRPTLCVIDYAAAPQKAADVVKILTLLAERARKGAAVPLGERVRVLVLERAGYSFGDEAGESDKAETVVMNWLRSALEKPETHIRLRDSVYWEHALTLGFLDPDSMLSIGRSWRHFQGQRPLSEEEEGRVIAALLGSSGWRLKAWRPLFAMMYAGLLDGVKGGVGFDRGSDVEQILEKALAAERETLWVDPAGQDVPPGPAAHNIACLATMIGTVTEDHIFAGLAKQACAGEALEAFYGDPTDRDGDEACLVLGYPSVARDRESPVFQAREPDLLGEYVILWSLRGMTRARQKQREEDRARTLIWHGALLSPDALLGFLIRLRQDFPNHPVTAALSAAPWPKGDYADADTNGPAYFGLSGRLGALLYGGASPSRSDVNGGFPLLFAAQEGHVSCVEALLSSGAAPNAVNEQNGTFPLLQAAQEGHFSCVEALLSSGAAPNAVNEKTGTFPLLMAAQNGHFSSVEALLSSGAAPNAVNEKSGTFPLLQAAQEGHFSSVEALLSSGAAPNAVNEKKGTFPLLMAAQNGHFSSVEALLSSGAAPNAVNEK
ncbi:MAG: ankyrin repeat domain-containing protein, partial [Rhodospirillum sp.]|nr:ankyrin repeat domain-containing protein [Rhodospirillum sp.]